MRSYSQIRERVKEMADMTLSEIAERVLDLEEQVAFLEGELTEATQQIADLEAGVA